MLTAAVTFTNTGQRPAKSQINDGLIAVARPVAFCGNYSPCHYSFTYATARHAVVGKAVSILQTLLIKHSPFASSRYLVCPFAV